MALNQVANCSGSGIEGDWSLDQKGQFDYINLRILSSGNFTINATSDNLTSAETSLFTTTNKVLSSTLSATPASLTVYDEFEISVSLKGEDDELYLGSSVLNISAVSGVVFEADSVIYAEGAADKFKGYSEKTGTKSFSLVASNDDDAYESGTLNIIFTKASLFIDINQTVSFI